MDYILASASPRRRELLKKILPKFEVIVSGEDENVTGLPPARLACALAEQKCASVFKNHPQSVVIGCDTIVVLNGEVLGKPKDGADAVKTLTMLSGATHEVITGVCVCAPNKKLIDFCTTRVTFKTLTREFIASYVAGGSPMDKAGSYGIQDLGDKCAYEGSYSNVVGLPLELLEKLLKDICG